MRTSAIFTYLFAVTATLCGVAAAGQSLVTASDASPSNRASYSRTLQVNRSEPLRVTIEKELTYDQHSLPDSVFQRNKIEVRLAMLDSVQLGEPAVWAIVKNRRNENGTAPLAKGWKNNEYKTPADRFGVERNQSVPLYAADDLETPDRYGRDGSLVKVLGMSPDSTYYRVECYNAEGVWQVPAKYVKVLNDGVVFTKAVMVDRTNQNICTVEKVGDRWLVRSQNPCTTGAHNPPYAHPTPVGMFVIQDKLQKMFYTVDGSSAIAGYAPWASRFTNGAYLHGVPVNNPNGAIVEFSSTLGTIPRSHECVRNASSHAKFIYDWGTADETIVFVFD